MLVYNPAMFRKSIITLAAIFCLLPLISAGETFELLDVNFPSIRPDTWHPDKSNLPFAKYPVKLRLHFFLTDNGDIDSIACFPENKKNYYERIESSLKNIKFYPALYKREPIPFIIPIDIEFFVANGKPTVELYLPYDDYSCTKRKNMLDSALELNGFTVPGLIKFPSYFCYFRDPTLTAEYPYAIFEIELDGDGNLIDHNEKFSNFEAFSRLLINAIMYARFQPEKYNDQKLDSKLYLIVRFFENLNYPVVLWPPEKDNPHAKIPFDYIRLESSLYLDSIVHPPIPTNAPFGIFRVPERTPVNDTAYVNLLIDSSGNVEKYEYNDYLPDPLGKIVGDVIPKLKFTPARDLSGRKVRFEGDLYLIFNSSKKIRIVADWLPLEAQIGWE